MTVPRDNPGYVASENLAYLAVITRALKQRITEVIRIEPGQCVLDVGCGAGIDTIPMAQLAGNRGLVVGADYDVQMINRAEQQAQQVGVHLLVKHVQADAHSLPFRSGVFDSCRSERLFQHLVGGRGVLKEMIRVTKSGGRIAIADSDWCTLSISAKEIDTERRIVRGIAELLNNGYAGRELLPWFTEENIIDITVEVFPIVWTDYRVFRASSFAVLDLDRKLLTSGAVSEQELRRFTMGHTCPLKRKPPIIATCSPLTLGLLHALLALQRGSGRTGHDGTAWRERP